METPVLYQFRGVLYDVSEKDASMEVRTVRFLACIQEQHRRGRKGFGAVPDRLSPTLLASQ